MHDPLIGFRLNPGPRRSPTLAPRYQGAAARDERWVDVERARYATRSYRASEGEPMPIRRAQMLLDLVRQMSITIAPDELIVGNRSLCLAWA